MNPKQLMNALQAENRMLRQQVQVLRDASTQAEFLEHLTASALCGALASGKTAEESAIIANDATEKCFAQFLRKVQAAQQMQAEEQDAEAKKTAGSIEQTIKASEEFQKRQAEKGEAKKIIME